MKGKRIKVLQKLNTTNGYRGCVCVLGEGVLSRGNKLDSGVGNFQEIGGLHTEK